MVAAARAQWWRGMCNGFSTNHGAPGFMDPTWAELNDMGPWTNCSGPNKTSTLGQRSGTGPICQWNVDLLPVLWGPHVYEPLPFAVLLMSRSSIRWRYASLRPSTFCLSPHREAFLGVIVVVSPAAGGDGVLVGGGRYGAGPPEPGGLPPLRIAPAGIPQESPPVITLAPCLSVSLYLHFVTLVLLNFESSEIFEAFGALFCACAGAICWTSRRSSPRQRAPLSM